MSYIGIAASNLPVAKSNYRHYLPDIFNPVRLTTLTSYQ
ncbi:hypothetical protein VRK_11790 [Vibrio sp. MEBiC08052]|nr:hypothetical protein VRK_11790 [Vibrio sp. MEBiC08052]